ncbi:hypothetical protein AcV5_003697 [Taiwanofungus camphoratus]|nr:hypothetical protein AcV5_003697 [Antrodia cinnamomea]KAI0951703.1 hypothetical protein AcV7_007726 [Antrodia cinnamomea]
MMHTKRMLRSLSKYAVVTAVMAVTIRLILTLDEYTHYDPQFSLEKHPFVPPSADDSRSPCPAMNALANHGYLPHDGRGITHKQYIRALREGYNLSLPLATFLTFGGHMVLEQYSQLSLADLGRHNYIEHNISLGHPDTIGDREYAPCKASPELIGQLINASSDGRVMTMHDFAKARLHRESMYTHLLDPLHNEIAHGEISMVLGIFGRGNGTVPVEWIEEWWLNERFPADFAPIREQTLLKTVQTSFQLKGMLKHMRAPGVARVAFP